MSWSIVNNLVTISTLKTQDLDYYSNDFETNFYQKKFLYQKKIEFQRFLKLNFG